MPTSASAPRDWIRSCARWCRSRFRSVKCARSSKRRWRGTNPPFRDHALPSVKVFQQPFEIIEFEPRPVGLAKAAAQFLEHAAGALHVDLARYFHRKIVAIFARAHRAPERI